MSCRNPSSILYDADGNAVAVTYDGYSAYRLNTASLLQGTDPDGHIHNLSMTRTHALNVSQDKVVATPSGAIFAEGIRDDIVYDFGTAGGKFINRLVDLGSVGGDVTHDTTNGGAIFSTGAAPGNSCIFSSDKNIPYNIEIGHGIIAEQTICLLDPGSLTGDGYLEWGFGDGFDGFGYGYDVNGLYVWLRKLGLYVDKIYQNNWNINPCLGSITSEFKREQKSEVLNINLNNLYRVAGEFLYAAEQEYWVKSPEGKLIKTHVNQYPNRETSLSISNANLPLFISIYNDTSSGGDIRVLSGSWRGGLFTSKNISIAKDPNNDIREIRLQGRHNDNSSKNILESNQIFRGKWFNWQEDYVGLFTEIKSDVSGTLFIDFSQETTPTDGDDSSIDDYLQVAYDPVETPLSRRHVPTQSRWVRLRYVNGSTKQSDFHLDCTFVTTPPPLGLQRLDEFPKESNLAGLVRSVPAAQQPDGNFVNGKADGLGFINKDPIIADGYFVSDWIDTDGWTSIEFFVSTDQLSADNGIEIQYTDDITAITPSIITTESFSYGSIALNRGFLERDLAVRHDGFRVKYTNGSIGQNEFFISVNLRTSPISPRGKFDSIETSSSNVTLMKGPVSSKNDAGDWDTITRSDDGGFRVSIRDTETDIPIKSFSSWSTKQINVGSNAVEIAAPSLTNRKKIIIKNDGYIDGSIYIGSNNAVTSDTGFSIDVGEKLELKLDDSNELWAILDEDAIGLSNTQQLSANSVNTNSGALNANNALSSDNSRVTFNNSGDYVIYNIADFNFTLGFDVIESVRLQAECRKDPSATLQTVRYQQSVSTTGTGGTSITSPTINSGEEQCYIVFISNGSDNPRNVLSVVGGGLTWSEVGENINSSLTGAFACWVATGTPSSSFSVTANFSDTVDEKAISVHRYSGVNQGAPIENFDIQEAVGSGTNTITSDVVSGTVTQGRFVAGINSINRELTLTNPPNLRTDLSTADINHKVYDSTAESNNQVSGSTSSNPDWIVVALTLEPAASADPIFSLSYEVGSEGTGATSLSQVVSETTDTTFKVNVTNDRDWTQDDIDNVKIRIESTSLNGANLEVDHISLEVIEANSNDLQRIVIIEMA